MLAVSAFATLALTEVPCTYVPGAGIGEHEVLLAGDGWTELTCAQAVLEQHQGANGVRLHGDGPEALTRKRWCSAVYGMRTITARHALVHEPHQASCYLYPRSSEPREVCSVVPAACFGIHSDAALELSASAVAGAIPTELGRLSATLEELDLSSNAISGTIPTQLGELTRLRSLRLEHAALSGSVPTELGRLTGLGWLALHGNALSGALPSELGLLNPARCQLIRSQAHPTQSQSKAVTAEAPTADDNLFSCPLPPLSTSCGMNGLAFSGRDAHHPGFCAASLVYSTYHAI